MREAERVLYPVYKQINLLLGWQSLIGALCVCFFFLLGREEGLSALLAVMAVTIPNVCFGLMLRGERDPRRDVIRAVVRIAFLLVNLRLAFAIFDIEPLWFFAAMALVQLSFFIGLQGEI